MSINDDYDRQISDLRRKMEEVEQMKIMHVKKLEGVRHFQELVAECVQKYGLSESELFVAKSEAIVAWIKAGAKAGSEPPLYWKNLKEYFAEVLAKEKKTGRGKASGKKAASLKLATLPTGVYRNQFNGDVVEKKRRNPKQLDVWVEEFGFSEVLSWRKP